MGIWLTALTRRTTSRIEKALRRRLSSRRSSRSTPELLRPRRAQGPPAANRPGSPSSPPHKSPQRHWPEYPQIRYFGGARGITSSRPAHICRGIPRHFHRLPPVSARLSTIHELWQVIAYSSSSPSISLAGQSGFSLSSNHKVLSSSLFYPYYSQFHMCCPAASGTAMGSSGNLFSYTQIAPVKDNLSAFVHFRQKMRFYVASHTKHMVG